MRQITDPIIAGLLEAAPDATVCVDESGRIVLVNAQAERPFGYPREELADQPVEILVPDAIKARYTVLRTGYAADRITGCAGDGAVWPVVDLLAQTLPEVTEVASGEQNRVRADQTAHLLNGIPRTGRKSPGAGSCPRHRPGPARAPARGHRRLSRRSALRQPARARAGAEPPVSSPQGDDAHLDGLLHTGHCGSRTAAAMDTLDPVTNGAGNTSEGAAPLAPYGHCFLAAPDGAGG